MTDPWRPQSIGDAMLHRSSVTVPPRPDWVNVEDLGVVCDEIYAINQLRQYVLWPMVLHRHGQECMRA